MLDAKLIFVNAPRKASQNSLTLLERALRKAGDYFDPGIWMVERVPRKALAKAERLGFKFLIMRV